MFKKKNSETLEEILGSSFIEAARSKKKDEYIEELNSLKILDEKNDWQPMGQQEIIVKEFYIAAKAYLDCRAEDWVNITLYLCIIKSLVYVLKNNLVIRCDFESQDKLLIILILG